MLSLVKTSGGGMNCRPKGRPTAVMAVVVDKYAEAKAGRLGFDWWICLLKAGGRFQIAPTKTIRP